MATKLKKSIQFETAFGIFTANAIIGEGGAGRVYEAVDDSGKPCAIKLLSSDKATREKLKRFKNEIIFCQQNEHKHILSLTDFGKHQGKDFGPFYVMPLYSGSLRDLMSKKIELDKALHYFGQILDGVEAAHLRKVVHRDLKPENILFDSVRDTLIVADFGIAQFLEDENYTFVETDPKARMANFQYAAPEQKARGQEVTYQADIYALGLILNEMFTAVIPQGTGYKTVESVNNQYGYLDEMIAGMIRQNPSERPKTINDIKSQLIGRKNEFITRQKISELNARKVVSVTEDEDPLIMNPVRVIDANWRDNELSLKLSQSVSNKWVNALQNIGSYTSVPGSSPREFRIVHDFARVHAQEHDAQRIIDYFKQWLPMATSLYSQNMKLEKEDAERRDRAALQREIEEQERRLRVNKNLKI